MDPPDDKGWKNKLFWVSPLFLLVCGYYFLFRLSFSLLHFNTLARTLSQSLYSISFYLSINPSHHPQLALINLSYRTPSIYYTASFIRLSAVNNATLSLCTPSHAWQNKYHHTSALPTPSHTHTHSPQPPTLHKAHNGRQQTTQGFQGRRDASFGPNHHSSITPPNRMEINGILTAYSLHQLGL